MAWHRPVTLFVLFNVIAAPLLGRLTWMAMTWLNADGARFAAVMVSLVPLVAIVAVNAALTVRAVRGGVPDLGRSLMWLVTALTFLLTIVTGSFSLVTQIPALLAILPHLPGYLFGG